MRQWGSRYAIRAGRNLPDKEFRYLRTVIVTAAVYRGFDQELAPHQLTFRHRAGVTPYTSSYDLAKCCVFNKQSLPPILCHPQPVAWSWVSLIPKLREHFAEFLNHSSLNALVYSTFPPVSVWGTAFMLVLFPGTPSLHIQSNKDVQFTESVNLQLAQEY